MEYKWRAGIIVGLGLFLSVLDSTIVSVALPAMRAEFHTDFNTITWVVTAYFLAQAAVIPVAGYLSTRSGTKAVFLISMGIFVVGSALCMLAPSKSFLIAARVIQGIGGGGIFPTSFAIGYRAVPRDEWGRATTIIGVPVLLAPALGPVLGGFLTSGIGWRAIFAVNLPLGALAWVLAYALLHSRAEDEGETVKAIEEEGLDIPGLVLAAAGFTTIVYGLTQAGIRGWLDRDVLIALSCGAALVAALCVVELRTRFPVLDVRLFRNSTFSRSLVVLWIVSAVYYGGLFLIPFFFEHVEGTTALTSGEIMITQGVAAAVGIALGGELYNRVGPRWLITAGVGSLGLSTVGFTRLSVDTTGLSLQVWLALRGLGLGITNTPAQNLALSVVNRRDLARGSSLVNVTRQVFIAAGVATMASIVADRAATHASSLAASVVAHRPTAVAAACLAGGQGALAGCITQHATVMGLNDAFLVALVCSTLAVGVALFVGRDPSLEALKGTSLQAIERAFPSLSRPQLVEAATRAQTLSFLPGEAIMRQGEAPDRFYIITAGAVRVSTTTAAGQAAELADLGPGDYVGEIGLMENVPRTATVTATEATQVLAIDASTFAEVVSDQATGASVRQAVRERMAALP